MKKQIALVNVGSNQTVLVLKNGAEIFFSYDTPVAVDTGEEILVTSTKYSKTTSKHINQWLNGRLARIVPQEEIDKFLP